jgi:hypothetical protein
MGNAQKKQCQRHGVIRPGPAGRIPDAASEKEDRRVCAERDRVRQAEHRSRVVATLANSQHLRLETEDGATDFMTMRDINRVSLTLATSVAIELVGCPGPQSRLAVMERFLNHGMI